MHCLIVDDDPLICDLLEHFAEETSYISSAVIVNDGIQAIKMVNEKPFDLVFLDLELPKMTGQEVLEQLPKDLPVIMITSRQDFALDSYNYHVKDYLLKPVKFARFYQAVKKVVDEKSAREGNQEKSQQEEIFIKDGHDIVKINTGEIKFIESESNYVKFHLESGRKIMSLLSMKKLEDAMPDSFVRIHRSFMINTHWIDKIETTAVLIGERSIPISASYRDGLINKLNLLN